MILLLHFIEIYDTLIMQSRNGTKNRSASGWAAALTQI